MQIVSPKTRGYRFQKSLSLNEGKNNSAKTTSLPGNDLELAKDYKVDCGEYCKSDDLKKSDKTLSLYFGLQGARGAALGASFSHIAMGVAGGVIGSSAGAFFGGIGLAIGATLGAGAGVLLQGKTMVGRKVGGLLVGLAAQATAPVAKLLNMRISSSEAKIAQDFYTHKLWKKLDDFSYSSLQRVSQDNVNTFVDNLKPGDYVLTKNNASTIFDLITRVVNGYSDFNHSLMYVGDGKAVEATTGKGVHEFDLKKSLKGYCHHAIAIRPKYEPGQAEDTVAAAREHLGKKYDYLFGWEDKKHYCSETIYKALESGAPQIKFDKSTHVLGRKAVLPDDLRSTSQATVVGEIGQHTPFMAALLSKFT